MPHQIANDILIPEMERMLNEGRRCCSRPAVSACGPSSRADAIVWCCVDRQRLSAEAIYCWRDMFGLTRARPTCCIGCCG